MFTYSVIYVTDHNCITSLSCEIVPRDEQSFFISFANPLLAAGIPNVLSIMVGECNAKIASHVVPGISHC